MDPVQVSILRDLILNTRKPIVLEKFCPKWKCFDSSIQDWCKKFDACLPSEGGVEFEQMPMHFVDSPQWERCRHKTQISFTDFINVYSKNMNTWTAFNYKQVEEIPLECRHDLDFTCFGFPQAAKDASLWLSSKGANTPCHYDTYGCNIVVQIYGKKHWLLFPPETQLTPIRVPYEESSVYCSENFFSARNLESFSVARQNAIECILAEGDVLIVPRNWWHYVESLDTSLSVNTWIPLEIDINAQIEECIVKFIIEKCVNGESEEKKQYILNPNQLEMITSSQELLGILRFLLDRRSPSDEATQGEIKSQKHPYEYLSETETSEIIAKSHLDIRVLKSLNPNEFDDLMHTRTKRYFDMKLPADSQIDPIQEALLNAICHPNVIKVIKDKFLKTYFSGI